MLWLDISLGFLSSFVSAGYFRNEVRFVNLFASMFFSNVRSQILVGSFFELFLSFA